MTAVEKMKCEQLLNKISNRYSEIIGENLIGIYIHGSLAFDCFHWNQSDIDFLVVVKERLPQDEKETLIRTLLDLDKEAPPRGFEMSVVLETSCSDFVYPTPFELHYSKTHDAACRENLATYCRTICRTDKGLAAHFKVIEKTGRVLCGKPVDQTFSSVPAASYLDSIKNDVQNALTDIIENPASVVLNLCRVLAYIQTDSVLSKAQGGLWAIQNLNGQFSALIQSALESYDSDKDFAFDNQLLKNFCAFMTHEIFTGDTNA